MFKVLLIAAASIGQIDRRLLAEGVGQLGPLEFDPYPTIHVRDLVAHDAHRHPFIEILGTMYLMKLRYAKHFGSRAGSAWRLLFIYALLPWMHQYRILGGTNKFQAILKVDTMGSGQQQVPTLANTISSTDARALQIENEKLKETLKNMSQELEELKRNASTRILDN